MVMRKGRKELLERGGNPVRTFRNQHVAVPAVSARQVRTDTVHSVAMEFSVPDTSW